MHYATDHVLRTWVSTLRLNVPTRPNLINQSGFKVLQSHKGAVALIQRFGSALNEESAFLCAVHGRY